MSFMQMSLCSNVTQDSTISALPKNLASGSGTMVSHFPHHPKVKGSSPATAAWHPEGVNGNKALSPSYLKKVEHYQLLIYKRTSCLKQIKFITEDTKVKHTNITAIYIKYFMRNYLQTILKCQIAKLGFVRSMIHENEGWSVKVWK